MLPYGSGSSVHLDLFLTLHLVWHLVGKGPELLRLVYKSYLTILKVVRKQYVIAVCYKLFREQCLMLEVE